MACLGDNLIGNRPPKIDKVKPIYEEQPKKKPHYREIEFKNKRKRK